MTNLRNWLGLAAGLALVSTPVMALAQAGRPYYGEHMWGSGWHGWFLGPLTMVFWFALLVGAIILITRWLGASDQVAPRRNKPGSGALELLRARFAKGDIDKAEFEERRALLES